MDSETDSKDKQITKLLDALCEKIEVFSYCPADIKGGQPYPECARCGMQAEQQRKCWERYSKE